MKIGGGDEEEKSEFGVSESSRTHGSVTRSGSAEVARVVETHISRLFFVGDRVYKVRKPVRFGFLDFSERLQREADCHREVELNRRLSPDVYLGVADVVMNGEAIEHMVVMRSLPHERSLAHLVRTGRETDEWLEKLAAVLASFHAAATRSKEISASATSAALELKWHENFLETDRFVGRALDPTFESHIRALAGSWLRGSDKLLTGRIATGHVCDGHGDLQAEDVFCLDDGVRVLDCLEFSDSLRYGDVCADVAFLAMDLERLGRPDAAAQFVSFYETHSDEPLPKPLLHHYIAQYAYVRAKIACLSAEQGVEGAESTARQLQRLALHHLRRAQFAIVLVGGLPGSGKSTLAAGLAHETGWTLLRSDEVRRQMPTTTDTYSPEAVGAVYAEMLRRARVHLARWESVILDATWLDRDERARAERIAGESKAKLVEFCCTCSEEIASSRMRARSQLDQDPSEATLAVRRSLAERSHGWPAATMIETSYCTPSDEIERALEKLSTD